MVFPFSIFKVSGHSMEPLLRPGDFVVVNRLAYIFSKPKISDLVLFRRPDNPKVVMLKRVVGVDTEGHYDLRGDNAADSLDGRWFGVIPPLMIAGKVWRAVSPANP